MRYGCVQFDEDRPGAGWASIEGDQSIRIRGIGDLRTDVQWWTSLSYDSFRNSGFHNHPILKNARFLRTEMEHLKEEFGCTSRFMSVTDSTEFLSEVFSRVMYLAEQHFGIRRSNQDTLARDIRSVIMGPDRPISEEIDEAVKHSFQTITKCERNPGRRKTTKAVNFRRPRYRHALDVLSVAVPGDKWEYISKRKLPEKDKVVDWILQEDRPCLARATVVSVPPEMSGLISFGAGANHERSWMSHPELVLLSRYCKVEIESLFMSDEYKPLVPKYPLPVAEGMGEMSIAFGILAENYWNGLANPQSPSMGEYIFTPKTAWLRASDRAFMFTPAMQVHLSGFHVASFGTGLVTVSVPFGQLQEVVEVAGDAGLMPPLHAQEDSLIQSEMS